MTNERSKSRKADGRARLPWPPPGCDLPDLATLEALSHGDGPKRQGELFPSCPMPPDGQSIDLTAVRGGKAQN